MSSYKWPYIIIFSIAALSLCIMAMPLMAHPDRIPMPSLHEEDNAAEQSDTETIRTKPWAAMLDPVTLRSETDAEPPAPQPEERCAWLACLPLEEIDDEVRYTVTETGKTASMLANQWGVPLNVVTILNDIAPDTRLEIGQKLIVQARLASDPVPYSSGKSSHGRLRNAILMPEGKGYFLRDRRPNSWGTELTVRSLVTAFHAYAAAYPEAPAINLGDISRRRGGRLKPHKSHQSGRDVDIGFVHLTNAEVSNQRFVSANAANLDVEKTWFFIRSLIQTGNVQTIYVDRSVQAMLRTYAARDLTPEQADAIFSQPRRSSSASALMQHWPGHRNHFHIRFKCPDEQPACRN